MSNKYLDIALEKIIKQKINAVLEQIRDEIEQAKTIEIKTDDTAFKASADVVINPRYRNFTSGLDIALQIIDKYKGNKQ